MKLNQSLSSDALGSLLFRRGGYYIEALE